MEGVDRNRDVVSYVLGKCLWMDQGCFSRCMEFSTGVLARPTKLDETNNI